MVIGYNRDQRFNRLPCSIHDLWIERAHTDNLHRIEADGPMPFDEYMEICLYDRHDGFFATGPIRSGKKGDFVTSPEITWAFGHCVGEWIDSNVPRSRAALVKIGFGSGRCLQRSSLPGQTRMTPSMRLSDLRLHGRSSEGGSPLQRSLMRSTGFPEGSTLSSSPTKFSTTCLLHLHVEPLMAESSELTPRNRARPEPPENPDRFTLAQDRRSDTRHPRRILPPNL